MRTVKIQETIETIKNLVRSKASPFLLLQVLVNDGFELRQAETILRWAMFAIAKEKKSK
jgi:hypothetical protein